MCHCFIGRHVYHLEFEVRYYRSSRNLVGSLRNCRRYARDQVLFENTLFQCVAYHPEEFHIITGGTDRKIAYWEATNGAQIRELEASKSGTINGLDIDSAGFYFVTVSADKLVKVSLSSIDRRVSERL
jgi:WD40 repeat protein